MTWRKLGRVFVPSGERPWMQTHAAVPLPLGLDGSRYRVYFSTRDAHQRSHAGHLVLDVDDPSSPHDLAERPALAPGELGTFDDHGVLPSSLVAFDGRLLLYYIGWNPGPREPLFYASVGLAVSDDGGLTFDRVSRAPVLARGEHDPLFVTSPFVLRDEGAWRMWYVSGVRWAVEDGELRSWYHVKHAESDDGVTWRRDGRVSIDNRPGERNIARPCVVKEGGRYRMWYSFDAGHGYRIGYAESADGYAWERADDRAGIDVSGEGWDSQAVSYPYVFAHGARRYLLYSGNDLGRAGFGLAVEDAA
jgi:hypothetical protein